MSNPEVFTSISGQIDAMMRELSRRIVDHRALTRREGYPPICVEAVIALRDELFYILTGTRPPEPEPEQFTPQTTWVN
ncbi:MAG: hypothetical protein NTW28_15475 [Candidatus Solibacter sp.]|nr:hypothetical protein [Candidatus Solibacter sp.]